MYNIPILDVIDLLGLPVPAKINDNFYIDCPFCGGKRKLNINIAKNAWRCPRCEAAGYSLSLYAKYNGISIEEAKSAYSDSLVTINPEKREARIIVEEAQSEALPSNKLNTVYRAFLNKCTLEECDKLDLLRRGLTEANIQQGLYKSVPHKRQLETIINEMIAENYQLLGVPGFYQEEETGKIKFNDSVVGYFVPVVSYRKDIKGMQIRTNNEDAKYIWLSSKKFNKGCKANNCVHFVGNKDVTKVYLTEGPLKANIANALSGKTFVAIPGVNCIKQLEDFLGKLKKQGVVTVVNAFDMDRFTNGRVASAIEKIKDMSISLGYKWQDTVWPEGKGIDDYLLIKSRRKAA